MQLTGPQGNAVVGLPHHVLAQLHRVVPVLGEDAEHVDDCVVDPIAVIRVGDCQCGGDYGQPDPVITLPPGIAELTSVKRFVLYGSNLVRIPPEIGAMTSLEEFTPYTSYRLHWFPYEITRCSGLTRGTVSTRALFGNDKVRAPFPQLQPPRDSVADLTPTALDPCRWGTTAVRSCSVCDQPIELAGLHQVWISMRVATDVLPLLVNACSPACVAALPGGAEDHPRFPHTGGRRAQVAGT